MKNKFILLILLGNFIFSGCTMIPDATTRAYVFDRMRSIQIGNTPEQVQYTLEGPPHIVSMMPYGPNSYELWEYRLGNFLYAETAMILFKNGRVIALPKTGNELIEALHAEGVISQAQFWKPRGNA